MGGGSARRRSRARIRGGHQDGGFGAIVTGGAYLAYLGQGGTLSGSGASGASGLGGAYAIGEAFAGLNDPGANATYARPTGELSQGGLYYENAGAAPPESSGAVACYPACALDPRAAFPTEEAWQAYAESYMTVAGVMIDALTLGRARMLQGLSVLGKAYELKYVARHLPGTRAVAKLLRGKENAHVFHDLATLARVEAAIIERGAYTGTVRGTARYGMKFKQPIGYQIRPDGTTMPLHYGEMKVKPDGLYHIMPRTGPSAP